jgi:hypothetical protein
MNSTGALIAQSAAEAHILQTFLRYPVDKDGKAWGGAHAFEATSFLKSLTDLHDSYARIRVEIDG